jgi:hypothetical protein
MGRSVSPCETAIVSRDETPPALTFAKFDESLLSLFGLFHTFVPMEEKRSAFQAGAYTRPLFSST